MLNVALAFAVRLLLDLAVARGFLLVTFGTGADSVDRFFAHPLSSTEPYSQSAPR